MNPWRILDPRQTARVYAEMWEYCQTDTTMCFWFILWNGFLAGLLFMAVMAAGAALGYLL